MAAKKNPVVHFEMPAENSSRMAAFYTKAFGWETQQLGPEMGNYVLARTGETGEDGFPKEKGMINGGFFQKTKDNQHPSVVISVDDIRKAMKAVTDAGGKVLGGEKPGEPDDIPGIGLYVSFLVRKAIGSACWSQAPGREVALARARGEETSRERARASMRFLLHRRQQPVERFDAVVDPALSARSPVIVAYFVHMGTAPVRQRSALGRSVPPNPRLTSPVPGMHVAALGTGFPVPFLASGHPVRGLPT